MALNVNPISACTPPEKLLKEDNKLRPEDRAVHSWYRFVLSFPPHLVREYLQRFGVESGQVVLDPFCGTGTTLVECKKLGIESIGVEPNAMAHFASRVKTDWAVDASALVSHASQVAQITLAKLESEGIDDIPRPPLFRTQPKKSPRLRELPVEAARLLLSNSISPLPLHKTLTLPSTIDEQTDERLVAYERLALATALLSGISNRESGGEESR